MKLYDDLQIKPDATQKEIKKAYNQLAKLYHPDRAGIDSAALFHRIQHAYEILSDPVARMRYDQSGDEGESNRTPIEVKLQGLCCSIAEAMPAEKDLISKMREFLRDQITAEAMSMRMNMDMAAKLASSAKNIRRRGKASLGASNPFLEALRAKEEAYKTIAEGKKRDIAEIEEVLVYLQDFESGEPKVTRAQQDFERTYHLTFG